MIKVLYDDERGLQGYKSYYDIYEMFFENLVDGKVNFNQLSNLYVKHLEKVEAEHIKQLGEIDMPLMNVIQPMKHLKGKPTIDAIYRYLVKYERFKGAPVWEDLVKYVQENNINLKGSYFVDLYLEGGVDNEQSSFRHEKTY